MPGYPVGGKAKLDNRKTLVSDEAISPFSFLLISGNLRRNHRDVPAPTRTAMQRMEGKPDSLPIRVRGPAFGQIPNQNDRLNN